MVLLFPLLCAISTLTGCGRSAPSSNEVEDRLVSLSPAITETLGSIGGLDAVVGRSEWCTHPPEASVLPVVGSSLTPDLERIATLGPTAILVDGASGSKVDELEGLARVEHFPWLTVDDVVDSTRRLGKLVDRQEPANALADAISSGLLVEPPQRGEPVLLVLSGEGIQSGEVWFIKRNSIHGAALHAAGARNAIDRDIPGTPVLSLEAVVALDPTTVVVLSTTEVDEDLRQRIRQDWGRLATVRAVKDNRIGVVGGPLALSPGPAVLDVARELRSELQRMGQP